MTEAQGSNRTEDSSKPWGKLTSFNVNYENVNLAKDVYIIGRHSSCDIKIPDIRLSGMHCKVFKDSDGGFWLEDLSSNGTFVDNQNLGKGNKKKLESGDKIYLLHPSKVKQEETIGYVFSGLLEEDTKARKRQREEDQKALIEEKKQNEKNMKFQEQLGEEVRCCICIDYIYQCVTLIPCLHNFCSACFSDWMQKSSMCPQCREEAIELKKNHVVNNLIEKFLESNPDKKRPKQEYEDMDKKNKIKEDRMILKKSELPSPSVPSNSTQQTRQSTRSILDPKPNSAETSSIIRNLNDSAQSLRNLLNNLPPPPRNLLESQQSIRNMLDANLPFRNLLDDTQSIRNLLGAAQPPTIIRNPIDPAQSMRNLLDFDPLGILNPPDFLSINNILPNTLPNSLLPNPFLPNPLLTTLPNATPLTFPYNTSINLYTNNATILNQPSPLTPLLNNPPNPLNQTLLNNLINQNNALNRLNMNNRLNNNQYFNGGFNNNGPRFF